MLRRLHLWPWLTFQIIAANVGIILALAFAWYWLFMRQSTVYSERLMSTFNIEPGQLHAMFVEDVERQLWASVIFGLLTAVFASIGLAFLIVSPLRSLARATERLRQGDYSVRSTVRSGEVGKLAKNFNALAAELEQTEKRRAQYLADLGHELRTPITSLRGYTEGLEDGVFKADRCFFALMSGELSHLTSLTHSIEAMELDHDDQKAAADGIALIDAIQDMQLRWAALFRQRDLEIELSIADTLKGHRLAVSAKSFRHVVDNLMSNIIRYADADAPCRIEVASSNSHAAELVFSNGAANMPTDAVPYLFDRFFRVSDSRTRERDAHSSGLGLSIVKQLCLANRGSVEAFLTGNRLSIHISLPLVPVRE